MKANLKANLGNADRIIRLVIGLVLIALPFVTSMPLFDASLYKYGAIAIGVILVATSALRFCPLYRIFGIRTCKV